MAKLRVGCFGVSLDGYGAGPHQDIDNPLGVGGLVLLQWLFTSRTFKVMHGQEGGVTGIDDDFAARSYENVGAWIIGRNMFGPVRGPWPDESWRGWWGENPPFHVPVFVLTHHARASITMEGGTVFHFVTEGIHAAWERARQEAKGQDVLLGGGIATVQQYLRAGLIDELHLAMAPTLLGNGEHFFGDIDLKKLGYQCASHTASPNANHIILTKNLELVEDTSGTQPKSSP